MQKLLEFTTQLFSAVVLIMSLTGCNGKAIQIDDTGFAKNGVFIDAHTYNSDPLRKCTDFPICTHRVRFNTDGTGVFRSLEQENNFTYKIANGRITTERVGAGDIPQTLQFDVLVHAMELTRVDTGLTFRLSWQEIEVYKSAEALSCIKGSGITLEESKASLKNAGINVIASSCGQLNGVSVLEICGGPTLDAHVHSIDETQLSQAKKLGYLLVSPSENPVSKTDCK